MTDLDDTRHCPMCEDAAKKILELEQHVKVLTDAVSMAEKYLTKRVSNSGIIGRTIVLPALREVLNSTPQQTAAQIERGHVEWMMKLPVVGFWWPCVDSNGSILRAGYLATEGYAPLYQIPQLPKENSSPETDLDEALRRQ